MPIEHITNLGREVGFGFHKIAVTGGAGFIGSHLVDRLIDMGHEVVVIDNLSTGKKENINDKAKFIYADVSDDINEIFHEEKLEYVFHLAALPNVQRSIKRPVKTHNNNLTGTVNVLNLCWKYGVRKIIYAASSSAYGLNPIPMKEDMPIQPLSPYAAQKAMGEIYCKIYNDLFGLPTLSLRFFNVYGHRQNDTGAYTPVMATFLKQLRENKALTIVGDGEQSRDFTHVSDVVEGLVSALLFPARGETINLAGGRNVSVNHIFELMDKRTPPQKVHIPPRAGEIRDSLCDPSKAKVMLNWEAKVPIETGIEELLSWLEK